MSKGEGFRAESFARSMGYDVVHREMIRTREELAEKLGFDGAEEQHAIMNNMVDARACYKPSGKVSTKTILYSLRRNFFVLFFTLH